MERPQLLGTEGTPATERCWECRGHVVRAGNEFVCTNCGVVARRVEEERFHLEVHVEPPSQLAGRRLGSFIGTRSDKNSNADFNGNSTVGYAKRISDNMGQDQTAWNCAAMIRRAADRLSLPPFVGANATALSEKMLADSRSDGENGKRRTSVPAISAYALLSACRAAGMDHIGSRSVLRVLTDMGHKATESALLQMGLESKTPFRPADPKALLRTVVAGLETDEAVLKKLRKKGFEPGPYFRSLLQESQAVLAAMNGMKDGRNPRTVAAGSVYMASKKARPRAVTQRDVAETMGVSEYTVREFVAKIGCELGPLNGGPS